jgi:hypothetical protein
MTPRERLKNARSFFFCKSRGGGEVFGKTIMAEVTVPFPIDPVKRRVRKIRAAFHEMRFLRSAILSFQGLADPNLQHQGGYYEKQAF